MIFDRLPFSPELVQARWELGKLPCDELPRIAQNALELGYDGRSVRRIAGLIQPDRFDIDPLIGQFFTELGIHHKMSREEAGMSLAKFIAQGILRSSIDSYAGARFIWWEIANQLPRRQWEQLSSFVGWASEWEDCPFYEGYDPEKTRRKIEEEIREAARQFLSPSK